MANLRLSIFSPERALLDKISVNELTLTGSEGKIQILPGHVPMIGTLETGSFHYQRENGEHHQGVISSGFFEVVDDAVLVVAETLELKGEIDVDRAKTAESKAKDSIASGNLTVEEYKELITLEYVLTWGYGSPEDDERYKELRIKKYGEL